jgi:hypothetical protein
MSRTADGHGACVAAASVAADECSRVLRQPRGRARSTKSRGLAADRMRSGTSAVRTLWDVCCEALWVSGLRRARWGARCLAAFSFVCA